MRDEDENNVYDGIEYAIHRQHSNHIRCICAFHRDNRILCELSGSTICDIYHSLTLTHSHTLILKGLTRKTKWRAQMKRKSEWISFASCAVYFWKKTGKWPTATMAPTGAKTSSFIHKMVFFCDPFYLLLQLLL